MPEETIPTEQPEPKNEKQDLIKNAFALINDFGSNLTPAKINTAKGITIFIMIAGVVIFSILWKNKFMMILTFVVGLIFLIAEFALESFFLGNDMINIKSKKERTKDKKTKEKKEGLLEQMGFPSAEGYSKQAEDGLFGGKDFDIGIKPIKVPKNMFKV